MLQEEKVPSFYLKSGKQTEASKEIIKISSQFKLDSFDLILEIMGWLHSYFRPKPEELEKVFRKRTADEIIKSRFITGCSDYALTFVALARAKKIPVRYVETISKEWLENGDLDHIQGHVFADVYINNEWYIVDPQDGSIKSRYATFRRQQIVFGKGLDSWDLGIKDLNMMKKKFKDFKEKYE